MEHGGLHTGNDLWELFELPGITRLPVMGAGRESEGRHPDDVDREGITLISEAEAIIARIPYSKKIAVVLPTSHRDISYQRTRRMSRAIVSA